MHKSPLVLMVVIGLALNLAGAFRAVAAADQPAELPAAALPVVVKLPATADIGVSSEHWNDTDERELSWGLHTQFKLKSIQEMAVVRFDVAAARGRQIGKATLFLHRASQDRLRYLRISTVNGDWAEGTQKKPYGPPSGACFNYADWEPKKAWSWPGSQLCDVVLGAGYSLADWNECRKLDGGWLAVDVKPALITALCVGDSDGLALQEGGDLAYTNNFIHSVQGPEAFRPYLQVELGAELDATPPPTPTAQAVPGTAVAAVDRGAIQVTIPPAPAVACWRLTLNGAPLPRWQVPHPSADKPTTFFLEFLEPGQAYALEIRAVSAAGQLSEPCKLTVNASAALPVAPLLGAFEPPQTNVPNVTCAPIMGGALFEVWACPGLVKISPETGLEMCGELAGKDGTTPNAVWDGRQITLFGARGEYLSCQLIVANRTAGPLENLTVTVDRPAPVVAAAGQPLPADCVELFTTWYAQNKSNLWQPAYCVPLKAGQAFAIPDPKRQLATQKNQAVYVDIYLPPDTAPGRYRGVITVQAGGDGAAKAQLPLDIEVLPIDLPQKLSFWPQLNAYSVPRDLLLPVYQLAQQHRNVFFYRRFRPKLTGAGEKIQVDWTDFDATVGPMLSGEAFKDNRRAGVPIEALGLPFEDSWPTPLTPETYHYTGDWVLAAEQDREKRKLLEAAINEHYLTGPRIESGLSAEYQAAFVAVQKQFIEHFREKGWDRTECQCLFMGKNTHRIEYKVNMWWTTDEPYHWVDWQALRFFAKLWTEHRGAAHARQWVYRADISRPEWQADVLDGIVDNIHFGTGAFTSAPMYRRAELLARAGGFQRRVYGSANPDNTGNHGSIAWFLNSWLHGANAALPWQAMGVEKSLDTHDRAVGGNALIVPGQKMFGVPVVADVRLKAFRDGEQLVEYLELFQQRYRLTRGQVEAILQKSLPLQAGTAAGAAADNADALRFGDLKAWQLSELRRRLAQAIVKAPPAP